LKEINIDRNQESGTTHIPSFCFSCSRDCGPHNPHQPLIAYK